MRFIKHRVSDHSQTTLFIRFIVFISEAVFFLLVVTAYPYSNTNHKAHAQHSPFRASGRT